MFGTKILEERVSKFNGLLRVVKSLGLGTYIQSGNLTQSGGIVETFWKQTLRKIKNQKSEIRSVLVLGLGGGTLVKLIRKNWPTARITGVDIDPIIVSLGVKYLKSDFSSVDVKIGDAYKVCEKLSAKKKKFDLIIVDLYNGDQFPKKFESKDYIHLIRTILPSGGIIIFNRLFYKEKISEAEKFGQMLKKYFKDIEAYRPVTNLMFICK